MNTTVIPCGASGIWEAIEISVESARLNIRDHFGKTSPWESAVGHESTAAIMTEILGHKVPVNRIQVKPVPGDRLLCFKLKNRAPEGVILSKQEIEKLGYEWVLMKYHGTIGRALDEKFASNERYMDLILQHSGR